MSWLDTLTDGIKSVTETVNTSSGNIASTWGNISSMFGKSEKEDRQMQQAEDLTSRVITTQPKQSEFLSLIKSPFAIVGGFLLVILAFSFKK